MSMTEAFLRHLTGVTLGPPVGSLRACLVLGMERPCPECGHYVYEEPAVIPEGLASWLPVEVITRPAVRGDLGIDVDRDLYWTAPVAGEMGWGLVGPDGTLIWYQMLTARPAKGDQVWVSRGSP